MNTNFEFDVFLSHNSADKPLVELIAQRLKTEFGLNPFLDKWNLIPGETWPNELERALDQSATTAVFLGAGGKSPWHDQEMQRALVKAVKTHEEYRIIPVLLPGADDSQVSGFLGLRTWVDFRGGVDDEEAFSRLVGGIKGEAIETGSFELPDDPAPYRGLSRFEKDQAGFFFGRGDDIKALITRLGNERFVAVVGASGSGKSSLVRAGLLPKLEQGALPGSKGWRCIIFLPGSEPLRALANQLVQELPKIERKEAADRLVTQLGEGENGLRDTLTSWYTDAPAPLLLIIDQFEELFTQCNSETKSSKACKEAARGLVAGVADLVQSGGGDIRVVITLRADFLDRCLEFPLLRALLQDRQLLLGELGDGALREVIVMPAQKVGAFFEKGLVNLILRDVTGERGTLPLLQHALFELWKARRGPWLMQEAYEKSGGVTGALKRFAQTIYEGLKTDEQTIARNIFVRITSLGDGVSDTRRRVQRSYLYPAGVDPTSVDSVIEKLSGKDGRLIVAGDEGVEVTHESLLQEWDTLRGWLNADRDAQRLRQQISAAAQLWGKDGESDDDLYKGARLDLAAQWEKAHPNTLTELEQTFLDASRAWRSKEQEKLKREHQEKEMQRQNELKTAKELAEKERLRAEEADARRQEKEASEQRLRKRAWGLGLAMVIAVVFMAGAIWLWRESEKNRILSDEHLGLALLNRAETLLNEEKPIRAMLTSGFAIGRIAASLRGERKSLLDRNAEPYLKARTIFDLTHGSASLPITSFKFSESVSSISLSKIEDQVAISTADNDVHVFDYKQKIYLARLVGHSEHVNRIVFSPNGQLIATASSDDTIGIWDLREGHSIRLCHHKADVREVVFHPNRNLVASTGHDRRVRIWSLEDERELITFNDVEGWALSLSFSPDGRFLAYSDQKGSVFIRNTTNWTLVKRVATEIDDLVSLAYSPDGKFLTVGSIEGDVALLNVDSEITPKHFKGKKEKLWKVGFTDDGNRVVSASWQGKLNFWDMKTREFLVSLDAHDHWVNDFSINPRQKLIASASSDKFVRFWDYSTLTPLFISIRDNKQDVLVARFSLSGRMLGTGSQDGTARTYQLEENGTYTKICGPIDHAGWVWSLAFSPDESFVVSAGTVAGTNENILRIWHPKTCHIKEELAIGSRHVEKIDISPDGRFLAAATSDKTISLWRTKDWTEINPLQGYQKRINDLAFDPTGQHLASAGEDGRIILWSTTTWRPISILENQDDAPVWRIAFHPTKPVLVAGGSDEKIRLWNLESERELETPMRTYSSISDLVFTFDGKHLLIGDDNRSLALWHFPTYTKQAILETSVGVRGPLDAHPKGLVIAFDGGAGTLRFLDLERFQPSPVESITIPNFEFKGTEITFVAGTTADPREQFLNSSGAEHIVTLPQCIE